MLAGMTLVAAPPTAGLAAVIKAPTVPQAVDAGDIVGFRLQNTKNASIVRRYTSFGQVFQEGQVLGAATLVAKIGGKTTPVQMDVKTRYPGGSVRFAVLTLRAPTMSAKAAVSGMLALGGAAGPAVDLAAALVGYRLTVSLSGGISKTIDVKAAMSAALANGSAWYWLRGPAATQARVDVAVSGSLHATFDITAYADGTFATDVMLNNDKAMQPNGGTVSYVATIASNGKTVFLSAMLQHFQYTQWHKVIYSTNTPPLNVQHDVAYIVRTGVIQNYDTATGVNSGAIPIVSYQPLGAAGITQYMPGTGDRADIGPMTQANAMWLLSQNIVARSAARAQADAAASIPWHFWDPRTGDYISLDDYPTLWADPRGNPTLTQPVRDASWTTDTSHQPDLSFIPYLLRGSRFDLDQINAQATFAELTTWNAPRQNGKGIVVNGVDQVRAQAWNLRQVDNAAWANPDGSRMKSYWQRLLANNYSFLLSTLLPEHTANAGAVAGYVQGDLRSTQLSIAPWQQDFLVGTVATSALRGNSDAKKVMQWMANWQVGRFTHQADGHGLAAAVAYIYSIGPDSSAHFTSWSQLGAANGSSNELPRDGGYWVPLGLETLANFYNVLGLPSALTAYNLVLGMRALGTDLASYQGAYAKFHVVPLKRN